jgi:RHS repeat-associated protein
LADYQNGGGFTGWRRGYAYLNGQLVAQYSDGTTYFVHTDHLGSTRLLTSFGQSQVANAGFESGSSSWSLWNSSVINNASAAHSGNDYLEMSALPGSGAAAIMSSYIAVTPGQQVTFGGWAYRESGTGGHVGWVVEVDNSSQTAFSWSNTSPWSADSPAWTYESGTVTVPAGGTYVRLYCEIWLPNSNTSARCDDGFVSTGSGASVVASMDYLPFGEATYSGSVNTTRQFTGKERDAESNLDYFGARYYASITGRFVSVDPVIVTPERIHDPQQLNRFTYVRNNPLRLVDPTGEILQVTGDLASDRSALCEIVGSNYCSRITIDEKTQTVGFDSTGLDLSSNEGAKLVNQLVASASTYTFSISDSADTAGGPVKIKSDGISNLDDRADDRYPKGKSATDLPPKGVNDQVTLNPQLAQFKDSQGRTVLLSSLAFHELAEAYAKVDGGKLYGNFSAIFVVNGTTIFIGPPQGGAHNEAVNREFKLREQRPNLQSTGRAGDQLIRDHH